MEHWTVTAIRQIGEAKAKGPLSIGQAAEIVRQCSLIPIPEDSSDNEWVDSLVRNGKHQGINIWGELRKYQAWASHKDSTASRKGFERWLDNAEAPLRIQPRDLPAANSSPEPTRWRERLLAEYPDSIYAQGKDRGNDLWHQLPKESQKLIIEELKTIP